MLVRKGFVGTGQVGAPTRSPLLGLLRQAGNGQVFRGVSGERAQQSSRCSREEQPPLLAGSRKCGGRIVYVLGMWAPGDGLWALAKEYGG